MGLREIQNEYVRLTLDESYRENTLGEGGVNESVFQSLSSSITSAARSLVSKRMGIVGNMLTHSKRALGSAFQEEFKTYALLSDAPIGVNRHRIDALGFAAYLCDKKRRGGYPPSLKDMLLHETAPIKMWMKGKETMIQIHRFHPGRSIALLNSRKSLIGAAGCPVLVRWRVSSNGDGYAWRAMRLLPL